ncbi:MAG: DEAD/DEAH box helicase family protein [Candidatus Poribacteria bacterium]|nr:DEAD/DEAH box helicase family protein [Candidatus Poribacteria bacterium]
MHLPLKEYQERTLETLTEYYQNCLRLQNANTAFYDLTQRPYASVEGLPGMPYVCLRLPTGGGKTFVACHAVSITASELLKTESPIVLWLVPSNAIRDQTLNALKNRSHPYRDALESARRNVEILTINEALYLSPHILNTKTTIIVSTMQAFRVEDTDGRKVYEPSGALMGHFTHLSEEILAEVERDESGKPVYSLANLLCVKRPLVIVDEAHNARTELSFETLARFNPSAIIEFTATPDTTNNPSNVLYTVSAAELQAEDMIKMPIQLEVEPDWKRLLSSAMAQRNALEIEGKKEQQETGEYIRPIMLIQAQPRRRNQETLTVEVVEQCLLEEHNTPEDQIARATGEDRGLDNVDLNDPECQIRYVITVQALREGWDCPFAYVLCSVAEMRSSTAVEQILGRVMRLPKAKRKKQESLNSAYAFVASQNFHDTASALADGLIQNGFEKQDAAALIRPTDEDQRDLPLFGNQTPSSTEPAPAQCGEVFNVPKLMVQGTQRHLDFEASRFSETPWQLSECSAELSEEEFPSTFETGARGEIGLSREGRVVTEFLGTLHQQMTLLAPDKGWDAKRLADWLDRSIKHWDILRSESLPFLQRLVEHLIEARDIPIEVLIRNKYALKDAAAAKIDSHRQNAHRGAYQNLLLPECETPVVVSPDHCFSFDPRRYPYNKRYTGAYQFQKHYYQYVGDLKSDGEEFRCAQFIDTLPGVKFWVRNLERQPMFSFWLQTSTDKFYPDFVCLLIDGRYLVVESKGEHLWSADDAKEKREIGELWEQRSGGKCLFIMPKGTNFNVIRTKLSD